MSAPNERRSSRVAGNKVNYALLAKGKGPTSNNKSKVVNKTKSKRKTKTPRRVTKRVEMVTSSNGTWNVTPRANPGSTPEWESLVDDNSNLDLERVPPIHNINENVDSIASVSEEGEIVDLQAMDASEFPDGMDTINAQQKELQAEISSLKKQLVDRKLLALRQQKAQLEKQLNEEIENNGNEDSEMRGNKRSSGGRGKIGDFITPNNEWEGLMSDSKLSTEGMGTGHLNKFKSNLPPFEQLKAMFSDEPGRKRKKSQVEFKTCASEDEESGPDHDSSPEEEEEDVENQPDARGKGSIKSGIFAKASSTKIVKSVIHGQVMLDIDETNGKDVPFDELPFNLLVAGELEMILGKCSAEEKWSCLNV